MITTVPLLLLPLVLAAAETPAPASAAAAAATAPNVAVTLVVGRIGSGGKDSEKTYKMLGQAGSMISVLMGWRMPLPTRSSNGDGEAASTSYVYQNIGVSADLRPVILTDGRFHVMGQVEVSGARDQPVGAKAPVIGTFQQQLEVLVPSGKRVRVAEAPDPEVGTLYLDLQVNLAN
jgi:hypothetical protein